MPPDHIKVRALTRRERGVLEYLLDGEDFPGRQELRDQMAYATVSSACECGCATRGLAVDRTRAAAAVVEATTPIQAPIVRGAGSPGVVILFVDEDGYMSSLEVLGHDGTPPRRLPPVWRLGDPYAVGPTAARRWWSTS